MADAILQLAKSLPCAHSSGLHLREWGPPKSPKATNMLPREPSPSSLWAMPPSLNHKSPRSTNQRPQLPQEVTVLSPLPGNPTQPSATSLEGGSHASDYLCCPPSQYLLAWGDQPLDYLHPSGWLSAGIQEASIPLLSHSSNHGLLKPILQEQFRTLLEKRA